MGIDLRGGPECSLELKNFMVLCSPIEKLHIGLSLQMNSSSSAWSLDLASPLGYLVSRQALRQSLSLFNALTWVSRSEIPG